MLRFAIRDPRREICTLKSWFTRIKFAHAAGRQLKSLGHHWKINQEKKQKTHKGKSKFVSFYWARSLKRENGD